LEGAIVCVRGLVVSIQKDFLCFCQLIIGDATAIIVFYTITDVYRDDYILIIKGVYWEGGLRIKPLDRLNIARDIHVKGVSIFIQESVQYIIYGVFSILRGPSRESNIYEWCECRYVDTGYTAEDVE
jgi:hypothetical protein